MVEEGIVISGKRSSAADAIFKIGENLFIEMQFKTGAQELNYTNVKTEYEKSLTKHVPFVTIQ